MMSAYSTTRRHWNAAPEDAALLAKARLEQPAELRSAVRAAMASHGVEYATALLYNALCDSPQHGPFIEAFHRGADELTGDADSLPCKVCIVPGAFYQQYPWTNAAGEALCREFDALGVPWEMIPTNGVGTLDQNARIVREYLAQQSDSELVLVSLSKGGCEVKVALREDPLTNVACWFNVSGILRGSLLVDWIEARPVLSWINGLFMRAMGRDYRFYSGMGRQAGGDLDFPLRTPEGMLVVHVSGFPLLRHTNFRLATTWYRRFQSLGPTDSAMLLEDLLELPGYVLPAWGIDHYWRTPAATRLLARGIVGSWQRHVQGMAAPAEAVPAEVGNL